jgi:CO/xanthine dehydrogenase FAD-binding subunit
VTIDQKGACQEARIVLGNAGVIPIQAKNAEKVLKGKKIADKLLEEAGETAAREAEPISDIHASEEYRRHLIRVLTERMVRQAWEKAIRLN